MDRGYKTPHIITIWTQLGEPDLYGKFQYEVKTAKCRYEQSDRLYTNEFGQMVRANSIVYAYEDITKKGDLVIKGDFRYSESPVDGAFEVKQRREVTNLRGTRTEYRYIL